MAPDPYLPYVSRVPLAWPDSDGAATHWLDGTLLFVDVAGFTALSERLAKQGRAGAEELTDLLDGAFARLLSAAYEDGGSLLSFGGDALLLFFQGPDHSRRAAHAAGVIKRKPAELGTIPTSAGPVRLKLSMGAHSGRFLFLVAGADSRVVLLLGPDVTATVRLEQRATAGQVYLGPSLAAAVPEAVGPVDEGGALLLRTPRPPLLGDPDPPGEPLTAAERFLAAPLREHIAGQATSEHRRVAVGFIQVRGTDALLAQDVGGTVAALEEIVLATQRAAAEFGVTLIGTDVDADGAKLILVAGAPKATEHEEERLLRTCRAVLEVSTSLTVRAGVTAGPVFVGDVGPSYRRAFTVMGERVNLAARLMGSAAAGELRTTPKVLAASNTRFHARTLEPLQLKGVAAPVEAVAVGAAIGQRVERGDALLLGRDDELAVLRAARQRAIDGVGGNLEIVGDPGSGKTALLNALASDSACPSLRVAAVPYEHHTPLGLVKRVLRHLLDVDAEADRYDVGRRASTALEDLGPVDRALVLVAADAELEGVPPAAVGDDDLFLQRLTRAVCRALTILVPGPALLIVEDLQWADASSLALLGQITESLRDHPWLLCTSRRPASDSQRATLGGEVVRLASLQPEAATDLVHALTEDTPLSPARVAALVARSGGNALFLTELTRIGADDDLPDSVEAVAAARMDALPTYLRTLLRKASALGAVFETDLLGELAGFVPDREEWRLLDGLMYRQGSRCGFVSEMFREVAYAGLLYKERRALHGAAGRALQRRGASDVELLALHASEAKDDELTWKYAVAAGRRAAARGAHEQAADVLRRALRAHHRGKLGPEGQTQEAQVLLGDALVRAGRPQESAPAYRRARELCSKGAYGDPQLLLKEALARLGQGRHGAAARWLRLGLAAVGPDDGVIELDLLSWLAGNHLRMGHYTAAIRLLDEVIERTAGDALREQNAHAHYLLHLVLTTLGDPRRSEHRTQALPVYVGLGNVSKQASILNNLGMDAYYEGRWSEAVELFDRSRQCEEEDANDVGSAVSESNIAEVLADQGHYADAHKRLLRALRTFLATDYPMGTATVLHHLGRLETRRGSFAEAHKHLEAAAEAIRDMGAESLLPDLLVRQAELAVRLRDHDRALDLLAELDRMPDVGAEMRLMTAWLRAGVQHATGDAVGAEEQLRLVLSMTGSAARFPAAMARHALATLLDEQGDPEAIALRHAALDALLRLGVQHFDDLLSGPVELADIARVVDVSAVRQERATAPV